MKKIAAAFARAWDAFMAPLRPSFIDDRSEDGVW